MQLALRLFGIPFVCAIAAFFVTDFAERMSENKHLSQAAHYFDYAGLALILFALLYIAYHCWRIWAAFNGKDDEACMTCAMPTSHVANGRYGPYYKCWSCGTNRADR